MLICHAGWGQITELAVDSHGRIFFSALQSLKGGGLDRSEKIFLLDQDKVGVYAVREWEPDLATAAKEPSVSADGSVVAHTLARFRPMWPPDPDAELEGVVRITSPFAVEEIRRRAGVRVSGNGRWALFTPAPGDGTPRSWWLNLDTREEFPAPARIVARWVADDGTAVMADGERLRVFTPGQPPGEFPTIYFVDTLWGVSRDGSRAGVSLLGAGLAVVDLRTGAVDVVLSSKTPLRNALMDPDGSRIFYVSRGTQNGIAPGRQGVIRLDLQTREQEVLAETEMPLESPGAVSPSGRRLYFYNFYAGIQEFDVDARRFIRRLVETPAPGFVPSHLSPATWFTLGIVPSADQARVLIGGREPIIYLRDPSGFSLVPDPLTPLGETELVVINDGSPFEPVARPVVVASRVPSFLTLSDLGPQERLWSNVALIFEEQTGDLVNPWRPVRPGDILRVYITGIAEGPEQVEWRAEMDGRALPPPEVLSMERQPDLASWWIARIRTPSVDTRGDLRLCLHPARPQVPRSCTRFPMELR